MSITVSTASSILSTHWVEKEFTDINEARAYAQQMRKKGFVVIIDSEDDE